MPKDKRPRTRYIPQQDKVPRKIEEPNNLGSSYFKWKVNDRFVDYDHKEWGWGQLTCRDFFKILTERLHEYESMTWDDLSRRHSCHNMPVENIEKTAQDRLCDICDAEVDSLYQVDINPRCRLWGYRDRTIFYLIWHDPNHSVYKTEKHNT
jgi:hypothetical protein